MHVLIILGVLGLLVSSAACADSLVVQVDHRLQTWEGFGASGCWWPTYVAHYPPEKQQELFDLLFGRSGIKLDIYRYNIPAGGGMEIRDVTRRTPGIIDENGKIDLLRDRDGIAMLKRAHANGVRRFILFSNSPPVHLTRNGKVSGGENGGENLVQGGEVAFADYLVEVARQAAGLLSESEIAISPINEPNWKWGEKSRHQEGCHYTPALARSTISALITRVKKSGLKVKVEAPETGDWKDSPRYADALLADETIRHGLDVFALHSYWTDPHARALAAVELKKSHPNIRRAMSEVCIMQQGHDVLIDSAIDVARIIHQDITVGEVISWQWWVAIAPGGYKDGLVYAHPKSQKIETTKRLYAIGNFSQFIRPGYVRVALHCPATVEAVAFVSPDQSTLVVVAINHQESDIALDLGPIPGFVSPEHCYQTNATHDLALVRWTSLLPRRSVTTLVWRR